jgi:outer membrane protein
VYTPNVSYNTATKSFGEQLQDNVNYSTAWTLSIPIFNNLRTRTGTQQARIRYEQARLQQTDQEQQLQLNVQQAIADQRASFRQYRAALNAFEASGESLRYANERFEQGAVTALELSTAKANLNRSNADMITARYSYLMALKSLEILQGLPLTL